MSPPMGGPSVRGINREEWKKARRRYRFIRALQAASGLELSTAAGKLSSAQINNLFPRALRRAMPNDWGN